MLRRVEVPPVVEVVGRLNPFAAEGVRCEMPAGLTVAEMLTGRAGPVAETPGWVACMDGQPLPTAWLHRIRPRPGRTVTVHVVLHDGGGDRRDGGKDTTRTIATIAVIAAALIIGPQVGAALLGVPATTAVVGAVTAGQIGTALVGTTGLLAVNAIAPPRTPQISTAALSTVSGTAQSSRDSPNYSIAGARNRLQPFGVVPAVFGRHRMVPPLGARSYTEILGGQQYLRVLVIWGYGPLRISDIRIGETPVGNFSGVTVETLEGRPTDPPRALFPAAVFEVPLSISLTAAAGFQTRTTEPDVDEISVDITFPNGLIGFDVSGAVTQGQRLPVGVSVQWETSPAGQNTWTAQTPLNVVAASTAAVRRGARVTVARGQYDVRLRRVTPDTSATNIQDAVAWTALRGFRNEDPIQFDAPLATTTLRILASNQLGGTIDQVNAIVESEVLDWDGATWKTGVSRNPASLFRHALQYAGNKQPAADAQIDLAGLQDWHDFCEAEGFAFNQVRDFEASGRDLLDDIAAAGRARTSLKDGKWSVIVDRRKTELRQVLTPFNSWGFSGAKVFEDVPHAYRARFVDQTDDAYRQRERIVYDDGYDASNATMFEGLELVGITDPDQIWKHAREHIATARLRPERFTLNVAHEFLIATPGDLVGVNHDVILAGISAGRVKSVIDDGEQPPVTAIGVVVDQALEMEAGQSYALAFRKPDDAQPGRVAVLTRAIVTQAGEQKQATFVDPIPIAQAPAKGDLYGFGLAESVTVEQVIRSVEPAGELTARLVLVDHAPAIFDASTGVIPPYDPQITPPADAGLRPAVPQIRTIQSDLTVALRNDDGSITERIVITCDPPATFDPSEVALELQLRRDGADDYGESIGQGHPTEVAAESVVGGEVYDLRIRRVASASSDAPGATSDWFEQAGYLVIGKTDPPPDVGTIQLEDPLVVWEYVPPIDFKGFRLRFHRGPVNTWADATPAHEGFVTETQFDISTLRGGAFTLLIKAVDSGLRESVNATSLLIDLGDPFVENIILEDRYRDRDYGLSDGTGTVTGGTLQSGELRANDTVLFWPSNPQAIFWPANGSQLFWQSSFEQMTYEALFTPTADHVGATISLSTTIQASTHTITYRPDNVPGLRAWPGSLLLQDQTPLRFRIVTAPGTVRGVISEFTVLIDVPDIIEFLSDVSIAAAGTRLPITETYRAIANVSLTLASDANVSSAQINDKNPATGPEIICRNAAGTAVAAKVDARVQGY